MATLTSTKIKNTYDALLKATDNDAIGSSAKQITDGLGNGTPLYISTTQIGIGITPEATYDLHVNSNAKVGGNLVITGDLTVNGTTTTVDTDTLRVEDPLIEVARNNTSTDSVDIGIYGKYAPSATTLYAGLFRDAGDDKFKLFKSLQEEPTTTVNTAGTGYTRAGLIVGDLEATQVDLSDDEKIRLGTSQDLEIYHDSAVSISFIRDNNTIDIRANDLRLNSYAGESYFKGTSNGAVRLYYDAVEKFITTSTGISVTGTVAATTFSGQLDGTISSTTTATTQTQGDNSTKVATTAYVDAAVDGVDTLAEILANGNTTGGTDIAISAGDKITNFTSTGIDDNASSTALTIDSSQNVGIGSATSPIGDLHVVGKTGSSGRIYLSDVDDGVSATDSILAMKAGIHAYYYNRDSGNLYLGTNDDPNQLIINSSGNVSIAADLAVDTNTLYVDSSNNRVGVGISSPSGNLQVVGASGGSGEIYVSDADNGTGTGDSLLISKSGTSAFVYNRDSGDISFGTNDTSNMMVINNSGNVGVGVSPSFKLDVIDAINISSDGGTGFVNSKLILNSSQSSIRGAGVYMHNTNDDEEWFAGVPYNVSFGSWMIGHQASVTSHAESTAQTTHAKMIVQSDGDILMNCTSVPSAGGGGAAFETSGTLMRLKQSAPTTSSTKVQLYYNSNGEVGSISTSGTSTSFTTSSDYRLKENVVEMTGALNRIDNLQPKRFNFIADTETTVDGFLAHEVQEVVPEAIIGEKDAIETIIYDNKPTLDNTKAEIQSWLDENNIAWESADTKQQLLDRIPETKPAYQGIDQSKLVPLLVGAIKELKARIEVLENS